MIGFDGEFDRDGTQISEPSDRRGRLHAVSVDARDGGAGAAGGVRERGEVRASRVPAWVTMPLTSLAPTAPAA